MKWSKKKPSVLGWWWTWTGLADDAPELVYIRTLEPLTGWYRGSPDSEVVVENWYAGPVLAPDKSLLPDNQRTSEGGDV